MLMVCDTTGWTFFALRIDYAINGIIYTKSDK